MRDFRPYVKKEIIVKDLTDQIPPQNLDAEASVIGSIMIDKDAIIKVADLVTTEDFYKTANGIIFGAMIMLYEKHSPIDLLTLTNKLEELGELEKIGGPSYLADVASSVPTAANVTHYAQIVASKATLRRMIQAAGKIVSIGYEEGSDVEAALDQAEQTLFNVSKNTFKENFIHIKSLLSDTFERIDSLQKDKKKISGVPSGFKDLDNITAGMHPSDLTILASRPAMGKTSLALTIARHVAVKEQIPVGFFALEMSKEQLVDRLISMEAGINSWKLRTGNLDDSDFPKIANAMAVLAEAPLYIDDSPSATAMTIRTKARRLQSEVGLGLIVVDYLQLMGGSSSYDNRVQEISEISRALKGLARELNVPVLALSQLSRAVESRPKKIPELSDLRDSGSIEQDADIVMFIYREEYYEPDTERKNLADIMIKKHRSGPVGNVELHFDSQITLFKDSSKRKEI